MSNYRVRKIMLALVLLLAIGIFKGIPSQAEETKTLNLEYLYMDSEEGEDGLGKMVIASVDTQGSQIEKATLEYQIPDTLEQAELESVENVEGYAAFLLPQLDVQEENLKNLYVIVNGETFIISLEEFYGSDDTEEAELEYEETDMVRESETLSEEELSEVIVATDASEIAGSLEQSESLVPQRAGARKVNGKVIIVLDPGHGGGDPGAVSPPIDGVTYYEKNINFKISKATKAELEKYAGVEVYMTRTGDINPSITARVQVAIAKKADVLVSQHLDSAGEINKYRGAKVFVSKGNYNKDAAVISEDIARAILKELQAIGFANRGVDYELSKEGVTYPNGSLADYYGIIRQSTIAGIPSMIVEHGFINNVNEIKELYGTEEKIRAVGIADAKAIAGYYGLTFLGGGTTEPPAINTGWVQNGGSWYYYTDQGVMVKASWIELNGKFYYLDANGKRVSGWLLLNNKWYYLDSNGVRLVGWQKVGNFWYYLNKSTAEMATGWTNIGGRWFYLDPASGAMKSNCWIEVNGFWYYVNADGLRLTGWVQVGGRWFYLDPTTGIMKANTWVEENGKWYYVNADGLRLTGWVQVGGRWFYLDPTTGIMKANTWVEENGKWYYVNIYGLRLTGWVQVGGRWFYLDPATGVMKSNCWIEVNGFWYYVNADGLMLTGWVKVGGRWFYLDPASGAMKSNCWIEEKGKWYYVNIYGLRLTGWVQVGGRWFYLDPATGVMKSNCWIEVNGFWYYVNADGLMLTGWVQIGGRWYYLDSATGAKKANTWIKVNGYWYYVDASGKMLTGWIRIGGNRYYLKASGDMAIGWIFERNNWYFATTSGAIYTSTTKTINSKQYTFNADGVCLNPYQD